MGRYVCKRIVQMLFVVLGVVFFIFVLLYFTPGDPARMILGGTASQEEVAALAEKMGLNDPFFVRFARYISDLVLRQDLGVSYRSKLPVLDEILTRLPVTFTRGFAGLLLSLVVGVMTGIVSAVWQYSWMDKICSAISVFCSSMPQFWFALELSLIFALKLRWLPPTGYYGPQYFILPVTVMGLCGSASIFRMTRSSVLEVIRMDYIRTARAKGQSERKVILHHALKNAMLPIVTMVGGSLGSIVAGSVVIESIFAIPGLGSYMLSAINNRDYPVIQGSVLILAVVISVANLLTDICYAFIDPRIKSQYVGKGNKKQAAEKEGGKL